MLSDEKIQEIIDKTDMVSLVSEYVTLTKKGSGYFGLCPFHEDSSPSFSVSVDKKIAKCMSCGEGGNPITFLRKVKNISFMEAAVILAEKASVEIDVNIKPKKEDKNKKYYDIYKVAQEFYQYNLFNSKSGKVALKYLNKRGLSEETIKMFGIGLAPSEKDTLKNVLVDKGFLDLDCIEIGLIKNNGTTLYDLFTNRIMFPITNESGQTIAFSGRLFDDSNGPKYVNTMETVIYRKGDHLYNLSNALQQINKTKRIILCEGQMDVIKISNSNLKDVVCALGSALTANQVKLIKKYATNVVLAYDNDNAGIKATKTAINLLSGLNIDVLQLPDGVDPDEFIEKNSVEKFHELFDKKVNSIEFVYQSYFKNKNLYSLSDVEDIKNNIFKFIKSLMSNTIKEQLFIKLSNDLKINHSNLLKDYDLFNGVKPTKQVFKKAPQQHIYSAPPIYDDPYFGSYDAPPIMDYIPEAPPEGFGVATDYSNHFNKKATSLNVENKVDNKKINKALDDACVSLISVLIYDKEHLAQMHEILKGKDIDEFMPDPYQGIFMHLDYLYNTLDFTNTVDILRHFKKDGFVNNDFQKILDKINTFTGKTKFSLILNDSINFIEEKHIEQELKNSNPIEVKNDIDLLNAKLLRAKEIDKFRSKKIKK